MYSPQRDSETLVLVVEDDRDDYFLTEDVLRRVPNHKYSIVWAGSYERAHKELLERTYDVALVDYRIGEKTGLDFIREAGRKVPNTPMILLTGLADPDIDRAAQEAGAADFLEKGAITVELLDRSIRYARHNAKRRALLDAVLSHASAGIVAVDAKGTPILWNPLALSALGMAQRPAHEIAGGDVARALDGIRIKGALPQQFEAPSGLSYELKAGRVPGSGHVIMLHDVTHRAKAEAMLREAVAAAEAASMAKSTFLATMSHELRTPMNGILGMARVLENTPLDDDQYGHVQTIKSSGATLLALINDILDLSKIEAGRMEVENIEFEIATLVDEVVALLAPTAYAKGIDLVAYVEPQLVKTMHGDPLRIRQVLTNLIGNAIKFTQSGGVTLWVSPQATDRGRSVQFAISDTGIGIPADKMGRLFQRFSQVDASTTRTHGGTGLGLALCKQIVDLMGGGIGCTSVAGEGSTFSFHLPVAQASQAVDAAAAHRAQVLQGRTVMVVGAGAALGKVLDAYVRSTGGKLVMAATEAEAARTMASTTIDALIVDELATPLTIAGVSQLTSPRSGTPPAIFAIAAATQDMISSRGTGVEVITRPFGRPAFAKICERLMRMRAAAPQRVVRAQREVAARQLRVLLAEDNEPNLRVACALLRSSGFEVEVAKNGRQVIEQFLAAHHDVILMDVNMPVMDGLEATRHLRADEAGRSVPIIGLTANASVGDRQKCIEAGMNEHMPKPVDWDRLIALLERIDKEIYGAPASMAS